MESSFRAGKAVDRSAKPPERLGSSVVERHPTLDELFDAEVDVQLDLFVERAAPFTARSADPEEAAEPAPGRALNGHVDPVRREAVSTVVTAFA